MPNNDYWKERMESIEEMSHKKGMAYTSHIDKQFRLAEQRINKQIEYWYAKIAENNGISLPAAKEMLRADELEDFKLTLDEYIKKGKSLDFDNRWEQQLINASSKVHIRRLEALQLQMQQECEVLFGNMTDGLDKTLTDIYTGAYYNTAYEFMRGHGVGWSFNKLDTRKIEQAINTAWSYDKKTFRARCWTNKEKLVNELNTTLTQSIIRGEAPQQAIDQLAKRMKVSKYSAGRLIMTESCAVSTMAQKGCYKELGVEKFEFVATLDSSTSDICRSMDGKVFDMADYKIGVNVPPLHCFCRSCTVPYYDDDFGQPSKRIARLDNGKTQYVPGNMKYDEWYSKFVDEKPKVIANQNLNNNVKSGKIESVIKDLPDYNKVKTKVQRKEYAEKLIDGLGIGRDNVDFKVYALKGCYGACTFDSRVSKDVCNYHEFALRSTDKRSDLYKIKTTFHEAYHYSLQGKKWDAVDSFGNINKKWVDIEETFAECSSHYASEIAGIKNIALSYPEKIANMVPRLKKLDQFKNCNSISDIGKIAWDDRLAGNSGMWTSLYDDAMAADIDILEYHKQYFDYIKNHAKELVEKTVENMPSAQGLEFMMQRDLEKVIYDVENGIQKPSALRGNEKIMYNNALANAMMQEGLK